MVKFYETEIQSCICYEYSFHIPTLVSRFSIVPRYTYVLTLPKPKNGFLGCCCNGILKFYFVGSLTFVVDLGVPSVDYWQLYNAFVSWVQANRFQLRNYLKL